MKPISDVVAEFYKQFPLGGEVWVLERHQKEVVEWLTTTLKERDEEVRLEERESAIAVLEEHAQNRKRYQGQLMSMIDRLKLHYETQPD